MRPPDRHQERRKALRAATIDSAARQRTHLTHALEARREQLTTVQHQLAGSRKPRWSAKRVHDMVALLALDTETLHTFWWEHAALDVIKARVAAAIARLDATLARLPS